MAPRHFLEVDDLAPAELKDVLARAEAWKRGPETAPAVLAGQGVAMIFE